MNGYGFPDEGPRPGPDAAATAASRCDRPGRHPGRRAGAAGAAGLTRSHGVPLRPRAARRAKLELECGTQAHWH